MMTAVALLFFALAAAAFGPRLLRGSDWLSRSPRAGILAWQALTASVVLSVVLAGVSLAVPVIPFTIDVEVFLEFCASALREQYSTPGGAVASAGGALLALSVIGRLAYCLIGVLLRDRRTKKGQLDALIMVAQRHRHPDALIVEHPAAAAYCLPGRRPAIVFTTAAIEALDKDQFRAVLAHEQAHLRGRHHLILAMTEAVQRAFPRLSLFRAAHAETAVLVELLADDNAARSNGRNAVATALVRLAERGAPPAALAAGGDTALFRVRRLVAPAKPLGKVCTVAAGLAAAVVIVLPMLILAAPVATDGHTLACPVESSQHEV